jgi:hypothetical protein
MPGREARSAAAATSGRETRERKWWGRSETGSQKAGEAYEEANQIRTGTISASSPEEDPPQSTCSSSNLLLLQTPSDNSHRIHHITSLKRIQDSIARGRGESEGEARETQERGRSSSPLLGSVPRNIADLSPKDMAKASPFWCVPHGGFKGDASQ